MSNTRGITKTRAGMALTPSPTCSSVQDITSIELAQYIRPTKRVYSFYVSYVAASSAASAESAFPRPRASIWLSSSVRQATKARQGISFPAPSGCSLFWLRWPLLGILLWVLHDAERGVPLPRNAHRVEHLALHGQFHPGRGQYRNREFCHQSSPVPSLSAFVYLFSIFASVVFHWGVTGIGAALLLMRSVDFLVRLFPTVRAF